MGERKFMHHISIESSTVRRYVRRKIQRRILSGESRPGGRRGALEFGQRAGNRTGKGSGGSC
jgi:hypothetical protein